MSIGSLGMKLHAGLDLLIGREHVARHRLGLLDIMHAVALFRRYRHRQLIARRLAGQGVFQPGDDVAGAVQVAEAAVIGLVDDSVVIVLQRVGEGNDPVFFDLHRWLLSKGVLRPMPQRGNRKDRQLRRHEKDLLNKEGHTSTAAAVTGRRRQSRPPWIA